MRKISRNKKSLMCISLPSGKMASFCCYTCCVYGMWLIILINYLPICDGRTNCNLQNRGGLNHSLYPLSQECFGAQQIWGASPVVNPRGITVGASDTSSQSVCPVYLADVSPDSSKPKPSTSCSAFVDTTIGKYILYCAAPPHKGILGYPVSCSSSNVLGEDMLFVSTPDFVKAIKVSGAGKNPLVAIMFTHTVPAFYEIKTNDDQFRVLPLMHQPSISSVSKLDIADTTDYTAIAFAVNNLDSSAELRDQLSPIVVAEQTDRNLTQCGFAEVKNAISVRFWTSKSGSLMLVYVVQFARSTRSALRFFQLTITSRDECHADPWSTFPGMGTALWTGVAGKENPFTVDNVLCGVQDVCISSGDGWMAMTVIVANYRHLEEGSCPAEELLSLQGEHNTYRRICGCAYAINKSFVVFSNVTTGFALDATFPSSFQVLEAAPGKATSCEPVPLICCSMVQLNNINGKSLIYALGNNAFGEYHATPVNSTTLPINIQSTSLLSCDNSTTVLSYHHPFPSSSAMLFKVGCLQSQPLLGAYQLTLNNHSAGIQIPALSSLRSNRANSNLNTYEVYPQEYANLNNAPRILIDKSGQAFPVYSPNIQGSPVNYPLVQPVGRGGMDFGGPLYGYPVQPKYSTGGLLQQLYSYPSHGAFVARRGIPMI